MAEKRHRTFEAGELDELIRRKSVYYFSAIEQKTVLFEGAADAVRAAAARGPVRYRVRGTDRRDPAHSG